MRSLWISVVILLLVFAFAVTDTLCLKVGIERMEHSLSVLQKTDCTDAADEIARLEGVFRDKHVLYSISLPMEDVDAVENALILLKSAQKNADGAAYDAALSSLAFALYRMRDAAIPSLRTVF